MALFSSHHSQSSIISSLCIALFGALGLLISLLIYESAQLTNVTSPTSLQSPLALFTLHKAPLENGGYQVSIDLGKNLTWYSLAWISTGISISAFRLRHAPASQL